MKKLLLVLIAFLTLSIFPAENYAAEVSIVNQTATTPQNVMFENCTKIFAVNKEKLFYLTLASLSANRFIIDEVQTSNGYVIFTVNKNKYLATVSGIDSSDSILKITPCNNVYNFPPGIITNTFKYIDLNLNINI